MRSLAFCVRMVLILQIVFLSTAIVAALRAETASAAAHTTAAAQGAASGIKVPVMEAYPNRLQARMEQRNRALRAAAVNAAAETHSGHTLNYIINVTKRWTPGQKLRIAFKGGTEDLHKKIADTVSEWTSYAYLTFDFGLDAATGKYRSWSPGAGSFTPDTPEIRVSFDQSGYFSLVGNDSLNPNVSRPGEESLNLEGFDRALPADWKAVALHEFGHAIGFEHEHQSPLAPCDFRFEDDAGYVATTDDAGQYIQDANGRRPGLYTLLGGPPNNWPRAVVDFNLKQLPESHAYETGPFDKLSIMKYFFPDWMFISGQNSLCYTPSESLVLSDGDKTGAAKVYPKTEQAVKAAASLRMQVLEAIDKTQDLPAAARAHFAGQLKEFRDK